jgi:hypothetical protein
MKKIQQSLLIIVMCLIAVSSMNCEDAKKTDPPPLEDSVSVNYSFVTMGCNRISRHDDDHGWDTSAYFNTAFANKVQLYATFDDVLKLDPQPKYFFFTGDLVLAENPVPDTLSNQLSAWIQLYQAHPISSSGITMVCMPGNHEFLYSRDFAPYQEVPNPVAHDIWLTLMPDFIVGDNGPGIGGPDSLIKDESKLTYSIDYGGDHFILMNTDTWDQPGKVPVNWIVDDMTTWRKANPKGHIFLFGHKPAYDASGIAEGDSTDPGMGYPADGDQVQEIWTAMTTNKAEAMFSAHEHLFWAGQPVATGPWQIIAGNAGTSLQSGDYFGFTEVRVSSDGSLQALSHGRTVPNPDFGDWGDTLASATTVRATFDLTWPAGN